MQGLPKIALAWLRANPGAPKSSTPPSGPDAFRGADHPDANLLAALVERTLTERERTQVLDHLSQCVDCREVAAFTLPVEPTVAEPERVPAGRQWWPWPVLRWGALAVVLGSLTLAVVLHPGMWNGQLKISRQTQPYVPAGNIAIAPPTVPAPPPAPPSTEMAQAKAQREAGESADKLAALGKAPAPYQGVTRENYLARAAAKPQATLMASSRPPAPFKSENVPAGKAEQEESRGGSALSVGGPASPAPPPPAAPATVSPAASADAMRATAMPPASAAALRAPTPSAGVEGAPPGAASAEGAAAKAATRASAGGALHMTAQAPMNGVQAFRKKIESGPGPSAALWSVSSDGKVQRSTDARKTVEQIPVAEDVRFRVIAALGNEVWTGGEGGALFHSADGGATWNRAGITFEGNTLTETITGIQLRDPQHLTVTTASGSQWVSEDGGQHWQKQP